MNQVKITYFGHSCFVLEANGYRAAIDPYRHGMIPGLPDLDIRANAAYCSHKHDDHGYVQAVTIEKTENCVPYTVEEVVTPHDDQGGKLRGMNTVHIFCFGDLRVAHLGDIGDYPNADLLGKLKGVDCLLIPVGGFFTINAETAKKIVDVVEPKVCVPMHYRTETTGLNKIAPLTDFTGYFDQVSACENTFALTKNTPKQILVIQYKP